ncbi:MAG: GNAT family N-acetyltransferase [Raineya sp.]|nr:GNAT family N-acetyltransferase [Raineya sp.]MDW8296578.1 GNAT family N-acetyltransferase [Raineya sp.]
MQGFTIRRGTPQDIPALLALIKELAEYEKAPQEVINTESSLLQDAFGEKPLFYFWLAWQNEIPVGMAVVYFRYSTWKGKCLYLEDIYIKENYRNLGIGKAFFELLCDFARKENCKRICWQVLEWNKPAIDFYTKIGAKFDDEWINGFLEVNIE